MKQINIGLIGLGTIGKGVVKILQKNSALIKKKTGYELKLKRIVDINPKAIKGLKISREIISKDINDILDDKEIDVVIELIGGYEPARTYILKALKKGKHVVTANKAVISKYGKEIFNTARKNRVNIGIEASVGGAIPIIRALKEALIADNIKTIYGIVNGTTNYILTKMEEGMSYEAALKNAQKLGFAERNPEFDVEGKDAAQKLSILASIAYKTIINPDKIYTEGITKITPDDICFAANWNYAIKLLAIAKESNNNLDLRVHPTMIPKKHVLASIRKELNAIFLIGDNVASEMLSGKGAGQLPTASAVISNIVDVVKGEEPDIYLEENKVKLVPIEKLEIAYYLRFMVVDKPGVLHKIAGILAKNNISVAEVYQVGRSRIVPLVLKTHKALEKNIRKAVAAIDKMGIIKDETMVIRIEE